METGRGRKKREQTVITEVEDKEFIALNAETIQQLLEAGRGARNDHRRAERRKQTRWPFPGTVQFWVRDSMGEEYEIHATCQNLNENGLGVLCERPFDVGASLPIAIHQPEATYHGLGVVRHCTPSKGGYFIGLELAAAIAG